MPKKRAQSPPRSAAPESETVASSSTQPPEPPKEPTPPLQVFYCASQSKNSFFLHSRLLKIRTLFVVVAVIVKSLFLSP